MSIMTWSHLQYYILPFSFFMCTLRGGWSSEYVNPLTLTWHDTYSRGRLTSHLKSPGWQCMLCVLSCTVRPGLKGPPSSRPFRVILIGLRKISRNFSTFHILTSQQFLETVSRFFAQTVRSYVCNIVLHPLLMAYVVEICDNYADLSRKVLLPMYIVHVLCAPRVWANPKQK